MNIPPLPNRIRNKRRFSNLKSRCRFMHYYPPDLPLPITNSLINWFVDTTSSFFFSQTKYPTSTDYCIMASMAAQKTRELIMESPQDTSGLAWLITRFKNKFKNLRNLERSSAAARLKKKGLIH